MMKLTRDALLKRPFADKKHYPYGFSRSGDFSIRESQLLQQYGSLLLALGERQLDAATDEDVRLLAVIQGEALPQSPLEKAWVKYQRRIHRPKAASIYGSKPTLKSDVVSDEDDDDLHAVFEGG